MPHPQTNLRLHPDTRAKAIAAAKDAGLSLSAYTERALIAYMDRVGGVIPGDSTEIPGLGDVVSDLVARVERIEQHLAQPSPPQASPHHPATPRNTPPQPQGVDYKVCRNIPANSPTPPNPQGAFPLADGVDFLTTAQAWEYCQGQGYQGTKEAFRGWSRRNLIPLMERYGIEPTGYSGKNNAVASYRRVMMPGD